MRQLTFGVNRLFALLLATACCSLAVAPVPGGIVYQTAIRNNAYKFDHADYSIFIPESAKVIRGAIIHQHGCTMEGTGKPFAYDVQYQALAKKWGLALVGPDLYPKAGSDCAGWINPGDGSGSALLAALDSVARMSGRAEMKTVPWLLWGHSGGGYWVLSMIVAYPQRIMAAFCYSQFWFILHT
jgi:poly(3-hydroxybutyrate) depolymerase